MKCHVKNCENHKHEGLFIGFLCSPCYTFLTTGEGIYSQLYRNTVGAEREACAKEAENRWLNKANCSAEEMYELQKKVIAEAIRARGQE